jgi:hypothetical protein
VQCMPPFIHPTCHTTAQWWQQQQQQQQQQREGVLHMGVAAKHADWVGTSTDADWVGTTVARTQAVVVHRMGRTQLAVQQVLIATSTHTHTHGSSGGTHTGVVARQPAAPHHTTNCSHLRHIHARKDGSRLTDTRKALRQQLCVTERNTAQRKRAASRCAPQSPTSSERIQLR